jgi:hypothetical protein
MTYDLGDGVPLRYEARTPDGTLTTATVVLTVTAPDGTTSTPSVTATSTGIYDATVVPSSAGTWFYVWVVTGNVTDTATGTLTVANPAPATYATLAQLKKRLNEERTDFDEELVDALNTASRDIDGYCGRRFYADAAATARVFYPRDACFAKVDDFYTTTGLVIAVDYDDDGTYETTWTAADRQMEPLNGVVDGEPGWPYWKLRAVGSYRFPTRSRRAPIQVTAKWGWAAVPSGVKTACLILAEETFKLREAPFGIANHDQFGPMRVRNNPMAEKKVAKYRRDPVMTG